MKVYNSPSALKMTYQILTVIKREIERNTGYAWKETSFLRDSPSHKYGIALDIAPHIHPSAEKHYAVYKMSDPVLYKRLPLIRALRSTVRQLRLSEFDYGLFVEPDHIHIQLFPFTNGSGSIYKWKVPKPIYRDTNARMSLPVIIDYSARSGLHTAQTIKI